MTEQLALVPPEYEVGDTVAYRGDPENLWKVTSLQAGTHNWWAYAEQNGTKQNFPAGVFTKVDASKKRKAPAPIAVKAEPVAKKRKDSVGDAVAGLMAEAQDITACWRIAEMAGLDIEETRTKIGHLSNGLQRMGIGNRLRKMWKDGNFDPESIICLGQGLAADFAFRADHPEYEGVEE